MVNRSHTFVARWWFYTSRALSMGPIAPIKLSVHVYGTSITYGLRTFNVLSIWSTIVGQNLAPD